MGRNRKGGRMNVSKQMYGVALSMVLMGALCVCAMEVGLVPATLSGIESRFAQGTNFATTTNPWRADYLQDLRMFGAIRVLGWGQINNSSVSRWQDRVQKVSSDQTGRGGLAYEWMIDYCNRQNVDLWMEVPHLTISSAHRSTVPDFALRLAILIKTGVDMKSVALEPMLDNVASMSAQDFVAAGGVRTHEPLKDGLKVYIEYSNETWNTMFAQTGYCRSQGGQLGLSSNPEDAGSLFHAWAAIRLFRAFDLVFGAGSPRVVRVLAGFISGQKISALQLQALDNEQHNPWGVEADAIAVAPYFGAGLDATAPDIAAKLHKAIAGVTWAVRRFRQMTDLYDLKLLAYEAGQHLEGSCVGINNSGEMYTIYSAYLDSMGRYVDMLCHLTDQWRSNGTHCWGIKEYIGQPEAQAPKYRALTDWIERNPQTVGASRPTHRVVPPAARTAGTRTRVFDMRGRRLLPSRIPVRHGWRRAVGATEELGTD